MCSGAGPISGKLKFSYFFRKLNFNFSEAGFAHLHTTHHLQHTCTACKMGFVSPPRTVMRCGPWNQDESAPCASGGHQFRKKRIAAFLRKWKLNFSKTDVGQLHNPSLLEGDFFVAKLSSSRLLFTSGFFRYTVFTRYL